MIQESYLWRFFPKKTIFLKIRFSGAMLFFENLMSGGPNKKGVGKIWKISGTSEYGNIERR